METMMSPAINELAGALSKAQAMMKPASKDRENTFFKSSYSTLASVIDAIREPFSQNGLAFVQQPLRLDGGEYAVRTLILHVSGQWIAGELSGRPVKADPQGAGSLISYLKRYGLQAMAGISSAEEDDDGNAATRPGDDRSYDRRDNQEPPQEKEKPKPSPKVKTRSGKDSPYTDRDFQHLIEAANKDGPTLDINLKSHRNLFGALWILAEQPDDAAARRNIAESLAGRPLLHLDDDLAKSVEPEMGKK